MATPLALTVEITAADGRRFRWSPEAKQVQDRPNIGPFATQSGDGFGPSTVELSRRRDLDWQDIGRLSTVRYIGQDGSIAYEGRIFGTPTTSGRKMRVDLVGWANYLKQRPFTEIYVDRDPGNWGPPTLNYRLAEVAQDHVLDLSYTAEARGDSLRFAGTTEHIPNNSRAILMYVSPTASPIAKFQARGQERHGADVSPNKIFSTNDDTQDDSGWDVSGFALNGDIQEKIFDPPARFLMTMINATTGHNPNEPAHRTWKQVAEYGDHSVTLQNNPDQPDGVFASDVIEDILGRFAPKLDFESQGTSYPISHLAFPEPVTPYDAIIQVNEFHHWHVGVFEGPTLHFDPIYLGAPDWLVREDWPGVEIDMGEDAGEFVNGVPVSYEDVELGRTEVLWPDQYEQLRDESETNPANALGEQKWAEPFSVPFSCTASDALQMGQEHLLDLNTPKAPGTIRVPTRLKDGRGNWRAAWRPRCGQSVSVGTMANPGTHLITSTSFDPETKMLEISTDYDVRTLDAFLVRLESARVGRIR